MPKPQHGDIFIRASAPGSFEVLQASTFELLEGPFTSFSAALAAARALNPPAIWQQLVDDRGRPIGDPFFVPNP